MPGRPVSVRKRHQSVAKARMRMIESASRRREIVDAATVARHEFTDMTAVLKLAKEIVKTLEQK